MDLYKDILVALLSKHTLTVHIDGWCGDAPHQAVEATCYRTLQRIRGVLDDDTLSDFQCIERIVELLEEIGSHGGLRHDFG